MQLHAGPTAPGRLPPSVLRCAFAVLAVCLLHASEEPWLIPSAGAELTATTNHELRRRIVFADPEPSGVEASFIARSLREVVHDDWRLSQRVTLVRRDTAIDWPGAVLGSEADRRQARIAGGPSGWDDFSVQWDGWIAIPDEGAELASISDDGSRLWLDRDGDDRCAPEEWASNGWGSGQGATQRSLGRVPPGIYRLRLQFEEGNGANTCRLLWRVGGATAFTAVPAQAFRRLPRLRLHGPVQVRSSFSGRGELYLGDGVSIATAPTGSTITVDGTVRLIADLDLGDSTLLLRPNSRLETAGHRLRVDSLHGEGSVVLDGGRVEAGSWAGPRVRGRGTCRIQDQATSAGSDASVAIELEPGASFTTPERMLRRAVLRSPLVTVVPLADLPRDRQVLKVTLAPGSPRVGVVAWRADRHGRWYQRQVPLDAAGHAMVDLGPAAPLRPEGHGSDWNALAAATCRRAGLVLYGTAASGEVLIEARWLAGAVAVPQAQISVRDAGTRLVRTGSRHTVRIVPQPFPERPLDPQVFAANLAVTAPDGTTTSYAGFIDQPYARSDRGDREELTPTGAAHFAFRWRPRAAGLHRLRVTATWGDGRSASADLPPVVATGQEWDDIVRVDADDPRFLSAGGRWFWPIGHNLNSTYDVRSQAVLSTRLTTDRGSYTRETLIDRLVRSGGTASEVWLSPWNLGIEWIDRWRGFHGPGIPNLGNAWALDALLDQAERNGMRLIISIFNHGMGRSGGGAEHDWRWHPYHRDHGGWLDEPEGLFTDQRAREHQWALFRYLAARYGDAPSVLAWKLWAEVNLVNASRDAIRDWHAAAATAFAAVDPWRHPVTSHWCADWRAVDRGIAAQPGIGMLTIDAYHGEQVMIGDLLGDSTRAAGRRSGGLADFGKPVLVTEYGGSAQACPEPRLEAEHAIGGWAALIHGHAGMPMLWWFEWIDQGGRYAPYAALGRFIAGEDLRGGAGGTVALRVSGASQRIWGRAWRRPGLMLAYLLDEAWAISGGEGTVIGQARLDLGEIAAGNITISWWDADRGVEIQQLSVAHPGGHLMLPVPEFARHLAAKIRRRS